MHEMNIDRWLAVAGLVVAILGVALAYYFYRKTIRSKLLAIAYTDHVPVAVFDPEFDTEPPPKRLARSYLMLWNRGTSPIEESDFVEPITFTKPSEIVNIGIREKDVAATVDTYSDSKQVRVQLLRPGEAVILEVLGEAENIAVEVKMKSADMSTLFQRTSLVPLQYGASQILISLGVTVAASAVAYAVSSVVAKQFLPLIAIFPLLVMASVMIFLERWLERIARNFTPTVVSRFFDLKRTASRAHSAATRLAQAFATLSGGQPTDEHQSTAQ